MQKSLIIMMSWAVGLVAWAPASIPRHDVAIGALRNITTALLQDYAPRAPLPNSQYSDQTAKMVLCRYNKAGAVTNIIYPGNLFVTYGWDQAGRLASVKDWASRTWTFSYDGANRLVGIQYPNGVSHTRGYNADGQLTNLVCSKSDTPFIGRSFQRNAAGMKTREVISAGLEVEQPDTWQKHTNDKADRLMGLTRRDEYVVPENWRGYTPSYNQEGQVTNVAEGYRSWFSDNSLVWDAAGRLIEYTGLRQTNLWTDTPPMPSWGLELGYDGLGARTVRTDELVTRRLVVDRAGRLRVPLMETDDGNTALRYYVWAPGIGLLAQIEADATIHYVHADENGSTLAMTDSNGDVTDQFAYSPWGELLGRTGTNTTAFTFVGGGGVTWEGGSLYRMGARYYDARLKRWLSADPIGMAGGANLYLYASANPLFWVDLLGLCPEMRERTVWDDILNYPGTVAGNAYRAGMVPGYSSADRAGEYYATGHPVLGTVNLISAAVEIYTLGRVSAGAIVGDAAESTAVRWGPSNGTGPLGETVGNTFRSGSYTESALSQEATLYRAFGGEAGELGSYWTRTPPAGPLQSTMDSALNPAWGNTAQSVSTIRVPSGTTIYEGFAAPQGGLLGGGSQVYIPRVNPNWLVHP